MKKRHILLGTLGVLSIFTLASCGFSDSKTATANGTKVTNVDTEAQADDADDYETEITGDFSVVNVATGTAITASNGVYTINAAGEYDVTGLLSEGYILVAAGEDDEVIINLLGTSITSTENSPILVTSAGQVDISAKADTYNVLTDNRESVDTDEGSGAIYAKADLKIKGNGALVINGNINNGIHSSKDLKIKNVTLKVTAINNAIKGNDSVTIESGNIIAISTGGDGIKTNNSDISSSTSKQRGTITITGSAVVDVYAKCDAFDAAYDIVVEADADGNEPTIGAYTDEYSEYSGEIAESSSTEGYMRLSSSYYNSYKNYVFAAYFTDNSGNGVWEEIKYKTAQSITSGRSSTTYYYYTYDIPSGYTNVQFYMFTSGTTEYSTSSYVATDGGGTINTNKNLYVITSVSTSSSKLSGDWSTYTTSSSDYSAKGLKTDNEINISAGNIKAVASDDAIHANGDVALENGNTGTGNVNISGGSVTVTSGDDGVHADKYLNISGGTINVVSSYEGLEGNVINISGGTSYVYATDDGVNVSSGSLTTTLKVSGGYLDVTVCSGDTDAIDSNGTITQSGGTIIARNPNTDTSGNMAAVDCDSTWKITGGTFVAAGCICTTPSTSNVGTKSYQSSSGMGGMGGFGGMGGNSSSSYSFSKGSYTVSDTNIAFDLTTTYYGLYIASDEMSSSGHTLYKDGSKLYSW